MCPPAALADCPGDLTGDNIVDLEDVSAFFSGPFGATQGQGDYRPEADFNSDNQIDISDVSGLLGYFAIVCEPTEPDDPPANDVLSADFRVMSARFNPARPNEPEWVEVGTAQNPVESGLRVRFEAPIGAGYYYWFLNGSITRTQQSFSRRFFGPLTAEMALDVYSADGLQSDSDAKTVHIAPGMQFLSRSTPPQAGFVPKDHAVRGADLWILSNAGHIGHLNISNPSALGTLRQLTSSALSYSFDIAVDDDFVYVAKGPQGVAIYRANPNDFALVATIPASTFGNAFVTAVATARGHLYAGTNVPGVIRAFDMTSGSPVYRSSLTTGGGLVGMRCISDALLLCHDGLTARIVSLASAGAPTISDSRTPGVPLQAPVLCYEGIVAIPGSTSTAVMAVDMSAGLFRDNWEIAPIGQEFALGQDRYYARTYRTIAKFDLSDPLSVYEMESMEPQIHDVYLMFLHDPDGPEGSTPLTLFAGATSLGFEAYRP